MNAETKHLLSEHLFNVAADEELDDEDLTDLYEEMEWQVWGVFEDWGNEDWESASIQTCVCISLAGRECAPGRRERGCGA